MQNPGSEILGVKQGFEVQKDYNGNPVFVQAEKFESPSISAADVDKNTMVRTYRNAQLFSSDWTQAADSPLSDEAKAEWATYRQALRDVTDNPDALPESPAWPTPPSA